MAILVKPVREDAPGLLQLHPDTVLTAHRAFSSVDLLAPKTQSGKNQTELFFSPL